MATNDETTPTTQEPEQDWYFTFGFGHTPNQNGYIVLRGTCKSTYDEMHRRYGDKWAFQYRSAEDAGVDRFGLRQIT